MTLFFPAAAAEIDWPRAVDVLDKELAQVVRDAELSRRCADKLLKVWMVDGSEHWLLIHVEQRGQNTGERLGASRLLRGQLEQRFAPLPLGLIERQDDRLGRTPTS